MKKVSNVLVVGGYFRMMLRSRKVKEDILLFQHGSPGVIGVPAGGVGPGEGGPGVGVPAGVIE